MQLKGEWDGPVKRQYEWENGLYHGRRKGSVYKDGPQLQCGSVLVLSFPPPKDRENPPSQICRLEISIGNRYKDE